jgi:hypothetical protein
MEDIEQAVEVLKRSWLTGEGAKTVFFESTHSKWLDDVEMR